MSKITPNVLVADPKATNGKMGKPVLTKGIELNKGIAQLKLNVDSIRTSSKSSASTSSSSTMSMLMNDNLNIKDHNDWSLVSPHDNLYKHTRQYRASRLSREKDSKIDSRS